MEENKTVIQEAKEEIPTIEETRKVIEEWKSVNAEKKALLDREERFLAMSKLGGRANIAPQADPLAETPKEYANRIMQGKKK